MSDAYALVRRTSSMFDGERSRGPKSRGEYVHPEVFG